RSGRAFLGRFTPCRPPRRPPASPTGSAPSAPRCHVSAPCSTCPREPAQRSVARVGAELAPPTGPATPDVRRQGLLPVLPIPHSPLPPLTAVYNTPRPAARSAADTRF